MNIKPSIKSRIKNFLISKDFLQSETTILEPGTSIILDNFAERRGEYIIYIDLSNLSNIDTLSIQSYIKPNPNANHILYLTVAPRHSSDEPLWMLKIPPCSGFKLKYTLATGKNTKIITSTWRA